MKRLAIKLAALAMVSSINIGAADVTLTRLDRREGH